MTSAIGSDLGLRDDPLYRQAMAHLQTGDWEAAIRALEALAQAYPDSWPVQNALEEARFRSRLDGSVKLRPKRWTLNWRPLIFRLLVLVAVVLGVVSGARLIRDELAPILAQRQFERQIVDLVGDVGASLTAEQYDRAREKLDELATLRPNHPDIPGFEAQLLDGTQRLELYERAVARSEAGETLQALALFRELQIRWPGYRDTTIRIQQIETQLSQQDLFREAQTAFLDGNCEDAVRMLEELQSRNITYQRALVEEYLASCYVRLGSEIVDLNPPDLPRLVEAQTHFEKALALRPKHPEASAQRELITRFLEGKSRYDRGDVERSLPLLRSVYDQQPGYLQGLVVSTLYSAYVSSGDSNMQSGNCNRAYEFYRLACQEVPVRDTTLACSLFERAAICVTPTATPTNTPTATPTATATRTPLPPPPPEPTITPAPIQSLHKGKILFYSERPGQTGWWVMNPDGTGRIYLGNASELREQYRQLRDRETLSPDGTCRVYTTKGDGDQVAQVYAQCQVPPGGIPDRPPTWKISQGLAGISYDPVWSPDGNRIAFVSQTKGSDDIWIANARDGSNQWNLTPNDWEWDKHPSWSPDSRLIVFWSNREGTEQIYIINADDMRQVTKISNTTWNEYDPVWIK